MGSDASLGWWDERLAGEGVACVALRGRRLRFSDPEGLAHELVVDASGEAPLRASAPDVPAEHALLGFAGVRAFASIRGAARGCSTEGLGFEPDGEDAWRVAGEERSSTFAYDSPPAERGIPGAGTIHHVAFASRMEEHEEWRQRAARAGAHPTPVIDRFYFRSVYFREPSGVLFELATMGPGFAVDEDASSLGQRLSLPPAFEQYRGPGRAHADAAARRSRRICVQSAPIDAYGGGVGRVCATLPGMPSHRAPAIPAPRDWVCAVEVQ